jgi:hypothetical protein
MLQCHRRSSWKPVYTIAGRAASLGRKASPSRRTSSGSLAKFAAGRGPRRGAAGWSPSGDAHHVRERQHHQHVLWLIIKGLQCPPCEGARRLIASSSAATYQTVPCNRGKGPAPDFSHQNPDVAMRWRAILEQTVAQALRSWPHALLIPQIMDHSSYSSKLDLQGVAGANWSRRCIESRSGQRHKHDQATPEQCRACWRLAISR